MDEKDGRNTDGEGEATLKSDPTSRIKAERNRKEEVSRSRAPLQPYPRRREVRFFDHTPLKICPSPLYPLVAKLPRLLIAKAGFSA